MLDEIGTFSNLDTSCQKVIRLSVMSYWLGKKISILHLSEMSALSYVTQ